MSQPELGIPREYLLKGLTDDVVQTYFEMMVAVAVEFGAPIKYAMEELSDVVMFEIELAKVMGQCYHPHHTSSFVTTMLSISTYFMQFKLQQIHLYNVVLAFNCFSSSSHYQGNKFVN